MAISGVNAKVLCDVTDLSAFLNGADTSQEAALHETTTFNAGGRTYLPGFKNGTAALKGFWDGAAAAVDAVLDAALGTATGQVMTIAPDGLTVGARLKLLSARETKYGVTTPVDGVIAVSADVQADGGIDAGVSLHALAAETATGSGASVDNAALSSNGGVAHLHVTAVTAVGGDTLDVVVQHSTNGSTWADLVTFTQITTAVTQERIVVAAGTTVNRYLRASWTKGGAGSPSYVFCVGFGRR
jgi:hypothetical protein